MNMTPPEIVSELDRFIVGQRDAIILKTISKPSPTEFKAMLKTARQQARKAGMKKSDIEAAIRKVRKRS